MADEFEAKLCHKYREYSARFVVIEERARPILSWQTFELLRIFKIDINSVGEENLLNTPEGIFTEVEKLKNF